MQQLIWDIWSLSKGGNGTEYETMDCRGPKVTGETKGGHCVRTYLKIPKSHQRFYINAYWSKGGMGAVLLQAKYSLEVIN